MKLNNINIDFCFTVFDWPKSNESQATWNSGDLPQNILDNEFTFVISATKKTYSESRYFCFPYLVD